MREIAALINSKKGVRRGGTQKDLNADGLPLPTFIEVEVRGKKLIVATVAPFYVQRSLDVVNWLLEQLKADAAVDAEFVLKTSPSKELTSVDEMAAATCVGHATVTYAPSKRAFYAVWGELRERAFFTIRREACAVDGRGPAPDETGAGRGCEKKGAARRSVSYY